MHAEADAVNLHLGIAVVQRATAAGVELNAAAYNVMLKELRLEGDSDGYARLKVGSHFRALRLIRGVPNPIVPSMYCLKAQCGSMRHYQPPVPCARATPPDSAPMLLWLRWRWAARHCARARKNARTPSV